MKNRKIDNKQSGLTRRQLLGLGAIAKSAGGNRKKR
jgi:hypothetical protein